MVKIMDFFYHWDVMTKIELKKGFYDNIMNPCIPGTYNFLEIVVAEIATMHHQINKDLHNHFHIGYV